MPRFDHQMSRTRRRILGQNLLLLFPHLGPNIHTVLRIHRIRRHRNFYLVLLCGSLDCLARAALAGGCTIVLCTGEGGRGAHALEFRNSGHLYVHMYIESIYLVIFVVC